MRQQPGWTPAVTVGCTEPAIAALNTVTLQVDKGVKEKLQFFIDAGAQKYTSIRKGSVYDPKTVVNVRDISCCTERTFSETEMVLNTEHYETTHTFI